MAHYVAHEQCGYFCKDVDVFVSHRLSSMPYAQAGIIIDGDIIKLISYSTMVIAIDGDGWLYCTGLYSMTTRRHIGAFCKELCSLLPGAMRDITYHTVKAAYEKGVEFNVYTGEIR